MKPIILDLCGGTGAWSRPWAESGEYDVRIITLPEHDVRTYQPPENVYGILAAPPCDDFAVSGARWFKEKDATGKTIESMGVVLACFRIISECKPDFWALENPVSRLSRWLGKPDFMFNPCDFGDAYTKKTCLWGKFKMPEKSPVEPVPMSQNHIWRMPPGERRKELRSITPPGFAKAFFEANRIRVENPTPKASDEIEKPAEAGR